MKIDKTSRAYQRLRSAYYLLWRQNPHVYRILRPLKMLSIGSDSGVAATIKFPPQRIKAAFVPLDSLSDRADIDPSKVATEIRGGAWDQQLAAISGSRIQECVGQFLRSPRPDVPEWEKSWTGTLHPETTLDRVLLEQTGGLKGLAELATATVSPWINGKSLKQIPVGVGRQGQLLCEAETSSVITLCISQLAGCAEIAGVVSVRHKFWQCIRKKFFLLAASAFSEGHGSLYQQLWHPDLMDVPHLHKRDERMRFIEAAAKNGRTGTALDIGANLGFFCHKLEDHGYRCHAVENNAVLVDHMRLLRDMEGKTFAITCGNILGRDMDTICSQKYHLVLALAVFHHFLKQKKTYEALNRLLENLKMERMVLQTHNPKEDQMSGAFRNLGPEEFADHIIDQSCLTKRELMWITPHGRHIYLLSRV